MHDGVMATPNVEKHEPPTVEFTNVVDAGGTRVGHVTAMSAEM